MKRHNLYKWFRNTVLVGLPIVFTTCCKYGMPEQEMKNSGTIVDKETQQPIPNVQVDCDGDSR